MEKSCSKCKKVKNTDKFYKNSRMKDGYQSFCKTCHKEYNSEYRITYDKINRERLNSKQRHRLKTDSNYKIRRNLRRRLNKCLKNKTEKAGSAVKDLGCSISELKDWISAKFKPGMSWDNYGKWHIDHIKPLSKFDLTDGKQFKEACNYKNLQPLWDFENRIKSNTYI